MVVGVRSTWMTANDCAATYLRSRLLFASEGWGRASFLGKGIDMYERECGVVVVVAYITLDTDPTKKKKYPSITPRGE